MVKMVVLGAFAAFVVSGPMQHAGVLPKTIVGDASITVLKSALNFSVEPAFGRCGGGGGGLKGNNGFGNGGLDGVPGKSGGNSSPNAGQKREDRVR